MLRNYFIVAVRNLLRSRLYTAVNVLGLGVGLASCVLILVVVRHEMSYDGFHSKADRVYRVIRETLNEADTGSEFQGFRTSGALAPALVDEFPEIELAVRIRTTGVFARRGSRKTRPLMSLVDKQYFDMFTFPLLEGNPATVFDDPYSVVLSESAVSRLFGESEALGKTVTIEDKLMGGEYMVTGIQRDAPSNSTLRPDLITATVTPAMRALWESWRREEAWRPVETYVVLTAGGRPTDLTERLVGFLERHLGESLGGRSTYHLQPLHRVHLHSKADYGVSGSGIDIVQVRQLCAIAALVLLIACINFVILATARSAGRAGEMGTRRALGADRRQLIGQVMGESVLVAAVAMLLALGVAQLSIPSLAAFMQAPLSLSGTDPVVSVLALISLTLLVGFATGVYPAIMLSRHNAFSGQKGGRTSPAGGSWLRKGLVVFQFSISVLLVAGAVVIHRQLWYVGTKDLGFDSRNVVTLPLFYADYQRSGESSEDLRNHYSVVKEAFLEHPNVLRASAFRGRGLIGRRKLLRPVRLEGEDQARLKVQFLEVDEDFLTTFGVDVISGRGFRRDSAGDAENAFLINESALKAFGWTDPIGKRLEWVTENWTGTVVGVVRDFHTKTLHSNIEPVVLCMRRTYWISIALRIKGTDTANTLTFLGEKWREFVPNEPFEYVFLDEWNERQYRQERRLGQLVGAFSVLGVLVACLGLFGLVTYTTTQRTREIGIRKAVGATTQRVLLLISGEYAKLVVLANLVALPVAFLLMNRWLQSFAYRTDAGLWLLLISGAGVTVVALGVAGLQALRAAAANPVDALKYE